MQTCRLCKKTNYDSREALVRYAPRHTAHFSCGLERWGADFLQKIPLHQIGLIPWRLVEQYDLRSNPRFVHYLQTCEQAGWPAAIAQEVR